jgi:hypothetical protein
MLENSSEACEKILFPLLEMRSCTSWLCSFACGVLDWIEPLEFESRRAEGRKLQSCDVITKG